MADNLRGGKISVKQNGIIRDAKGEFTCNVGYDKNDTIIGVDDVHGYSSKPQAGFCDGTITDSGDLDLDLLMNNNNETITVELANGKTFLLPSAWWAGEGDFTTSEGEIKVRWEAKKGKIV